MNKLIGIALLASTAISTAAYAEENNNDIIVTARKTEERLQDVPVSVRYFGEEEIKSRSAVTLGNLPGFNSRVSSPTNDALLLSIHGQFQADPSIAVDSAVAVYFDGVYIARSYGLSNPLLDVKNVQVLYGPQGTLFGRNSTGGAILLNTNDPTLDAATGSAELTYGRFNERQATVISNLPLSDTLAVRVAATSLGRDGFITDTVSGKKLNDREQYNVRGKVLFEPNSDVRTVFSAEYFDSERYSNPRQMTYGFGGNAVFANPNPSDRITQSFVTPTTSSYINLFSTTDIGNLKIVGGWRKVKSYNRFDADGSVGTLQQSDYTTFNNISQITAEAQYSNTFANVNYMVGAFYFNEKGDDSVSPMTYSGTSIQQYNLYANNKSYGAFVNGSYPIGAVTVNAGVRYTHDVKATTSNNYSLNSNYIPVTCMYSTVPGISNCAQNYQKSFNKTSWSAGLDYRPNDSTLLFAKVATGYKSGGINAKGVLSAVADAILPEDIIEYQVGVKSETGPVTYSLTGFYNNSKNVQVSIVYTVPHVLNNIRNAATVRVYGGEAEIRAKLTDHLNLTATGMITQPKYTKFINPATGQDISDIDFNMVIKKQFNLDAAYDLGRVTLHANYTWTDKFASAGFSRAALMTQYGSIEGAKIHDSLQVRRNGIINLRADVKLTDNLDFSVWGRNVTDSRFFNYAYLQRPVMVSASVNDPATYGVTFKANF